MNKIKDDSLQNLDNPSLKRFVNDQLGLSYYNKCCHYQGCIRTANL